MPIETGRYCGYCTDDSGQLQSFDERFERMVAWQARRDPQATGEELERQTLDYMATMPAWRDHPRSPSPDQPAALSMITKEKSPRVQGVVATVPVDDPFRVHHTL
jgi:hypothetical protein